jgi:hypothetical protein
MCVQMAEGGFELGPLETRSFLPSGSQSAGNTERPEPLARNHKVTIGPHVCHVWTSASLPILQRIPRNRVACPAQPAVHSTPSPPVLILIVHIMQEPQMNPGQMGISRYKLLESRNHSSSEFREEPGVCRPDDAEPDTIVTAVFVAVKSFLSVFFEAYCGRSNWGASSPQTETRPCAPGSGVGQAKILFSCNKKTFAGV